MTREQTLEAVLRKAQQILREDAAVLGPCDHSVGLCVCDITKTVDDIDAALATPSTSEWDDAIEAACGACLLAVPDHYVTLACERAVAALKRKEQT